MSVLAKSIVERPDLHLELLHDGLTFNTTGVFCMPLVTLQLSVTALDICLDAAAGSAYVCTMRMQDGVPILRVDAKEFSHIRKDGAPAGLKMREQWGRFQGFFKSTL